MLNAIVKVATEGARAFTNAFERDVVVWDLFIKVTIAKGAQVMLGQLSAAMLKKM
jgi:hypothetical protein